LEKPKRTPHKPARGTKIEWATHTANWLAGCSKASPACQHCYAETMTARLATMPHAPARYREGVVEDRRWTGRIAYDADALHLAFTRLDAAKSPQRVFVNSMSDTFHEAAPQESLRDLARAIQYVPATGMEWPHVVMLLTKRPDRMLAWQREHFPDGLPSWVWVGCTVEDQRRADERLDHLLNVHARVHFASVEPLLGPLDLEEWMPGPRADGTDNFRGLSWLIVGGESGPRARPMHPEWARSLRDQCVAAGVAFHFKQVGAWAWDPNGDRCVALDGRNMPNVEPNGSNGDGTVRIRRMDKHAAGRLLDGRTWDEFPGEVRGG